MMPPLKAGTIYNQYIIFFQLIIKFSCPGNWCQTINHYHDFVRGFDQYVIWLYSIRNTGGTLAYGNRK